MKYLPPLRRKIFLQAAKILSKLPRTPPNETKINFQAARPEKKLRPVLKSSCVAALSKVPTFQI